jgi:DNA processing protein
MDVDARVEAWASLQLIPGLSTRALSALLKALGGPAEVLGASQAALSRWIPHQLAAALRKGPDPGQLQRTLAWLAESGHSLVAWDDVDYPAALLAIADPPLAFYHVGRRELLNRPALAIVGSRNATPQGIGNAEAFAEALSAAGLTIISGLAVGIDAAAHRGGLAGAGSSIAVVGTGLDRIYPAANRDLAERLSHAGSLVSEFPLGTPPLRANFPRRNRVISGLSRGVLVVEATLNSDSLITARLAGEQGREVFAIPGSIHSPFSKGSHRLIRDGAKLVETAQDVLEELGLQAAAPPGLAADGDPADVGAPMEGACGRVLAALGHDPVGIDALTTRTGLQTDAVAAALVELELAGRIVTLLGGTYQRLR